MASPTTLRVETVLARVVGNVTVLAKVRRQRRVPFLPEEEVRRLRDARVRETVRYAAETVPYYRDLFRAEGIDPREIRTAEDLEWLPILEKEAVRAAPDRFVSESAAGRSSIPFVTSGSTGLRIRVHHDRRSLLHNIAYSERHREVEVQFVGKRFRYVKVSIGRMGGTGLDVRRFYNRTTWIPLRPKRHSVSKGQPIRRIVDELNELRPDVVRAGGSFLELLFGVVAARGYGLHLPRVVSYGDDVMTPEGKELIEREFGVPVLSHYNATEVFHIGFLCEEREHFHLHADLSHLTIVDSHRRRAPPGTPGDVVLSNLINRGSVLLNYRIGDRAAMVAASCPCGRTGTMLSQLEGRVEDTIYLPGGRFVNPRLVWDVIKKREGIVQYQLVQLEQSRFELTLVTPEIEQYERVVDGVVADLRELLGADAEIRARRSDVLERGAAGKLRPVRSLCGPPPLSRVE
jgi:phenylacetate-CoA ligase